MPAVTVEAESYRWPEQLLNAAAHVVQWAGLDLQSLDFPTLIKHARRRTKLHDLGDPQFEEATRQLVNVLEQAGITPLARIFSRQVLMRAVTNRLKLQDYVAKHPEVHDIEIRRPIFVVGFPRTGTTVLQNLLALPDDRRALQFWELTMPTPVSHDKQADEARRIASIDSMLYWAYVMAPEMAKIHEITATSLEEDWSLFANTGAVLNYDFQSGRPEFGQYLFDSDITWAYREFRTMLQVLLHQRPASQLVLKCPEHLWFLDKLLDVFPDACVVWTHRDPFNVMASYCSLISMNRRVYYGRYLPSELGPYVSERFHLGVERALAVRDARGDHNFLDMRFVDLVSDQAASVARIHDHFDLPHPPDMDQRVQGWLDSKRADKRGSHIYDADRYGLDRDAVTERFADYLARFDIPQDRR